MRTFSIPAPWMALPAVLSALGSTWRDLGRPEEARDALLAAIQAEDRAGRVPIRDIEQLANVEARSGEKLAREALEKSAGGRPGAQLSEGLKRIDRSIQRLETLDALVATDAGGAQPAGAVHAERLALQGSAYKRKAAVLAWQLQAMLSKDSLRAAVRARLEQALKASVEAYRRAEGVPERDGFSPYNALNRLALEALSSDFGSSEARNAAVQLAQRCGAAVQAAIAASTDPWNAVMQPEAILVAQLCSGALGEAGDVGEAAQKLVLASYADALSKLIIKPWQLDSVVTQLELLAGFSSALRKGKDVARKRIADRLLELARQLQPTRAMRGESEVQPEVHDENPE